MGIRHWDRLAIFRVSRKNIFRQPAGLGSKDKAVAAAILLTRVWSRCLCGEVEQPGTWQIGDQVLDIDVPVKPDVVPIIESRTPQRPIIHSKTGHADDMEIGIGCGT